MATFGTPPTPPDPPDPPGPPDAPARRRLLRLPEGQRAQSFLSGVAGGLVVLVAGAVLIATGAIEGKETVVQRQAPISKPSELKPNGDEGDGLTVSQIYDRFGPGVVYVQAEVSRGGDSPFGFPQLERGVSTGSGLVLDTAGHVLTNAHVVEGARSVQVRFGERDETDAKVVGADPSTDLAILKVSKDGDRLKPLVLGDSSRVRVGDPTVAIGNPFGFDRTVTTGIVSALQRQITAPNGFSINDVIQTDASINPGNSGGPLLDAEGKVIGINSQIATGGSSGSVGIGFAVPANTAKRVIPQLKRSGTIERAYLGVTTAPVTRQIARDLNLPTDKGALVQEVVDGGPAGKAGIRAGRTRTAEGIVAGGDLIVKVGDRAIVRPEDVAAAIETREPGDEVTVELFRGGKRESVKVKLGKRPERVGSGSRGSGPQPPEGPGGPDDILPFP